MGSCSPSLWHRFQRYTLSRGKVDFGRWLTPGFPPVSHRECTLWDPGSKADSLPRDEAGLAKVTVARLKAALEERGLDTSGLKQALIARLCEAFRAHA